MKKRIISKGVELENQHNERISLTFDKNWSIDTVLNYILYVIGNYQDSDLFRQILKDQALKSGSRIVNYPPLSTDMDLNIASFQETNKILEFKTQLEIEKSVFSAAEWTTQKY